MKKTYLVTTLTWAIAGFQLSWDKKARLNGFDFFPTMVWQTLSDECNIGESICLQTEP